MKTMAMLAVTHGIDNDSIEQWSVSRMPGEDGVVHGPWEGELALQFMEQFDYICLWHWPSQLMVDKLPGKLIPFLEIDAVANSPVWHPYNERLRQIFTGPAGGRMIGAGDNRFDHPFVDPYEPEPGEWNEKPHCHMVDMQRVDLIDSYVRQLQLVWDQYTQKPLGVAIDSVNPSQYLGRATNKPFEQLSATPWAVWMYPIIASVAPIWAHNGTFTETAAHFNMSEHALRDMTLGEVAQNLSMLRTERKTSALAVNGPEYLDKFTQLLAIGVQPDIVQKARGGMFAYDVDFLGK